MARLKLTKTAWITPPYPALSRCSIAPSNDECNRLDAAMWVKSEYPLGRPILGHQDEGIGELGVRCVDQTARAMSGDLSRHELGIVDARYFSNKHRFGAVLP
jgi:hypothetical protein